MPDASYALLPQRGLIALSGPDARTYLQGLVSNDVDKVGPGRAQWSAFLTPQGKYLFDFFLVQDGERLLIECEEDRREDFMKRLRMYKLRSKIELAPGEAMVVAVVYGADALSVFDLPGEPGAAKPFAGGVAYADPRLAQAGARLVLPADGAAAALEGAGITSGSAEAYDAQRMRLGLPDSSRDLVVDKAILLENGFDELHGVDWDKGCYMGQELTARTRYRGMVRKRLLPVLLDGPVPDFDTPVMAGDIEAGRMRSATEGVGLALMRLEHLEKTPMTAGEAKVQPVKPDWAVFPAGEGG